MAVIVGAYPLTSAIHYEAQYTSAVPTNDGILLCVCV